MRCGGSRCGHRHHRLKQRRKSVEISYTSIFRKPRCPPCQKNNQSAFSVLHASVRIGSILAQVIPAFSYRYVSMLESEMDALGSLHAAFSTCRIVVRLCQSNRSRRLEPT